MSKIFAEVLVLAAETFGAEAAAPDALLWSAGLLFVVEAVAAWRAFASRRALALAMALLALDALRPPLLPEAKRADEDAASADDEYDAEEVLVAGIRDASVDGEKAWLLHPRRRTEQTAGAAVAVANLIF